MLTIKELDKLYEDAMVHARICSDDIERQVGAVAMLSYHQIYSSNTFLRGAKGLPNTRPEKYEFMIHAEANLVFDSVKFGESLDKAVVFCTLSPCQNCIRTLWQAGVSEVYFKDMHSTYNPNMRDLKITEIKIGPYTYIKMENW